MAEVIRGALVAARIKEGIRGLIESEGLSPCLGIVRVGSDSSDLAYERGIIKTCSETGINVRVFEIPEDVSQDELDSRFRSINEDVSIHGILVFRPLPGNLSDRNIVRMISPEKDMDCMCDENWIRLLNGDDSGYYPCTAESVIRICDHAGVEYDGAKAVVIGRSQVIGKPIALMLLSRNATVTWCHSRTRDISRECENADILVSACGRAELIDEKTVSRIGSNCTAIDVGVNFRKDGSMCGDFNFEQVSACAARITPVPGGVGAVTNSVLAAHVARAAYKAATGSDIKI